MSVTLVPPGIQPGSRFIVDHPMPFLARISSAVSRSTSRARKAYFKYLQSLRYVNSEQRGNALLSIWISVSVATTRTCRVKIFRVNESEKGHVTNGTHEVLRVVTLETTALATCR